MMRQDDLAYKVPPARGDSTCRLGRGVISLQQQSVHYDVGPLTFAVPSVIPSLLLLNDGLTGISHPAHYEHDYCELKLGHLCAVLPTWWYILLRQNITVSATQGWISG